MTAPPSPRHQLSSLQMLRAIAAVLVVFHHTALEHPLYFTNTSLWRPVLGGWIGVDIFFVLSGYLIYRIHHNDLGQPARLGRYAWRRFSRIFPPFWCAAALILGGLVFRQVRAGGWPSIWDHVETNPIKILLNLILWPQYPRPYPVSWTLTYELWFYALIGALFFLPPKVGKSILAIYAAVVLAVWGSQVKLGVWPDLLVGRPVFDFLAGVGIFELSRRGRPLPVAAGAALAVLGFGIVFSQPSESVGWFGFGGTVGAIGLLAFTVRLEETRELRIPGWILWIGGASYSIYLLHNVGITLAHTILNRWYPRHASELPPVFQFAPIFSGILLGCLFHIIAERPLLKLVGRKEKSGTPRNPSPEPGRA